MLRLKILFCLDDLFYFRVVISLSCLIQCCFVALHDYDCYALWLVASQSFASLPPAPSGILLVLPHSLSKPVVPYESTIPTYIWYLFAIPNEDFLVPTQNLIQKFPFCNHTSSCCSEGKSVSSMPKMFYSMEKVLTSHFYEAEAGLENAQLSLFHNL